MSTNKTTPQKYVGFFIDEKKRAELKKIAFENGGMDLSKFVRQLIDKALAARSAKK